MKIIFFSIILYASQTFGFGDQTSGTTSPQRMIGFSNYFNQVTQLSERSFKIFAGSTGRTCSGSGQLPCNSCDAPVPLTSNDRLVEGLVCNNNQIYPDLLFSVTMTSTAAEAYPIGCTNLIIGLDGVNPLIPFQVSQYAPLTANQNVTASWRWSGICQALSGDGTCQTSFTKSIRIGFNSTCGNTTLLDGAVDFNIAYRFVKTSPFMSFGCPDSMGLFEGYCDYTVFPGDKKLYILNSAANVSNNLDAGDQSTATTPALATARDPSGIKYSAIRAFYDRGGFDQINLNSNYVDIPITLSGGLSDRRVPGLDNDVAYSVIMANKDEAGNIELFAHPGNPGNSTDPLLQMSDTPDDTGSTQAAIPQPVVGLLEDQRCFIATAAFGDPNDAQVKTLRGFRDTFLLQSDLGKEFVNWYYRWSPKVAKKIAESRWLRRVTRVLLWPLVWAIQLAQAQESFEDILESELTEDTQSSGDTQQTRVPHTTSAWPEPEPFIKVNNEIKAGSRRVNHPLEERGLLKINADGSYDYAVFTGKRKKTTGISFYSLPTLNISGAAGDYSSLYGTANPFVLSGSLEWLVFPSVSHNLGMRVSGGIGSVTGSGVLLNSGAPSEEQYSMYTLPLTAHLVYRFDYFNKQVISPYAMGGAGYLALIELRDDSGSIRYAGAPFVETGAGLMISLMRLDAKSMFVLRRDFDISDIWINFESKVVKSLKPDIDFEGLILSAGLVLDF